MGSTGSAFLVDSMAETRPLQRLHLETGGAQSVFRRAQAGERQHRVGCAMDQQDRRMLRRLRQRRRWIGDHAGETDHRSRVATSHGAVSAIIVPWEKPMSASWA